VCPGPEAEKDSRLEDDRSCWPVGAWMVLCNYPVVDDAISIGSSMFDIASPSESCDEISWGI
jgi:hypothetical protein